MSTYLWVDLATLSVPLAFSFHPKLQFHRTWFALWPALLLTAILFLAWDALYTSWGVWGFNERHVLGLYLFGLPLEEWLFFICIPYSCTFTHHCLTGLIARDWLGPVASQIGCLLGAFLVIAAAVWSDLLYTSVTCLATACLLFIHTQWMKSSYLGRFFLTYVVTLLPFLIVNGILTGLWIEEEVVWYNNAENVDIRLLTIPLEDFVYAMFLLLGNVTLFEIFKARKLRTARGQ